MPAFPVIINASNYDITTGSSLTYQQFLGTLYYIAYKIKNIYLQSNDIKQLSVPFTWNTSLPDGSSLTEPTNANIDPYQSAAVLNLQTDKDCAVINISSSLKFMLAPANYLELIFDTETTSFSYLLNDNSNLPGSGEIPDANITDKTKVAIPVNKNKDKAGIILFILSLAAIGYIAYKNLLPATKNG